MENISVVIWLLLLSVAASDKLPDAFSELLGGSYLPPSNSFSQPPKDPFQGLGFAIPLPSNNFPQKTSPDSVEEENVEHKKPSKEPHTEVHEGTCILANPYPQASHSHSQQEPPRQTYIAPEPKEIEQTYGPPKFSDESKGVESFETPDSPHPSAEASNEKEFPQPQFLYEPPEQSPSSHFATSQHNFKPKQPESPQKTYQVPELIQTYITPKPSLQIPEEDSREGSIHFSSHHSPPKNSYNSPKEEKQEEEEEEGEGQQSSSLFFKVPQRPKVIEEDSRETYKAPSKPKQTYEIPRPSYEVPRPTYERPQVEDNKSEERPSQDYKKPSSSNFFSIPSSQGSGSIESSNESPEGSYNSQGDEEDIPPQQEVEQSEEAYRPPSPPSQRPKETYRQPQKSKPSFKPTDNVKFRPLFKKPKPAQPKEDSREHKASSSNIRPSSGYKIQEPSNPHNFFKIPTGTKNKESSENRVPIPSKPYDYQEPKKESEEEDELKKGGSILFPTKQTYKPPKKNKDDEESKERQPTKNTYRQPQKTHKSPSEDDSDEKPDTSNLQSTFQKPEESKSQETEATTKKMMMPYEFKWNVDDDDSGNKFGQTAVSDGMVEKGSYHVLLPDGRKQIVTYLADWETGFHVDVKYEGEVDPFAQGSNDQKSQVAYS